MHANAALHAPLQSMWWPECGAGRHCVQQNCLFTSAVEYAHHMANMRARSTGSRKPLVEHVPVRRTSGRSSASRSCRTRASSGTR